MSRIQPSFGRIPSEPDVRDFKMADAVREFERLSLPERTWHADRVLNQFDEPACTGFAWAHWGIATPIEDPWKNEMGRDIYAAAKRVDGFPNQPGSTIRASAKVMLARGHFKTYYFANSISEAADYVARWGPVVLGTDWYRSMNKPSLIRGVITPSGGVVGGHAYLWIGLKRIYGTMHAVILNSWGVGWGKGGYAYIRLRDLEVVFVHRGEACAATEIRLPLAR